MLGRTPISDDALPARPGDNTPPDHGRPGDNHARPGWPMPLVWRREHGSECGQLLGLIDAAKPKLSLNAI